MRWPCALLLLAGCVDSDLCPAVMYIDAFQLVLSSETWSSAQYSISVSYTDPFGEATFLCDVAIPAVPMLDAGPDAGIDARGNFACKTDSGRLASGQAGQEIELGFEGTPASVHLVVLDAGRTVLDQQIALDYQLLHPDGADCVGPQRAAARIELPQ